ncbi:MAG: hypothetical protein R3203_01935 [Pseudoalteromonas tetraodonis]|nr:hypothetical protein [Pseudoalteromonas tetraodonis]
MQVDVLVLEWTSQLTRDRLVSTLISNYLKFMGCEVFDGPLQNGMVCIDSYKPKVLLLVNTIGSKTAIEIAMYAKKRGVIVVSLFGEGNFTKDRIQQFVWGHNKKQRQIDDYRFVWSQRAQKLINSSYPKLKDTTFYSGSVGADNYIMNNTCIASLKKAYPKLQEENKVIIGVGCWNFCLLNPKDHRYEGFKNAVGDKEFNRLKYDGTLFNNELSKLVKERQDVVFLIKEHPHKSDFEGASGIDGLEVFENVIVVDKDTPIIDCINISDVWLTYESTTAFEAWLSGTPTGLLNPTGVNFLTDWRAPVYKGQPNFDSADSWGDAIDYFGLHKSLPGFSELSSIREELLEDVFGHSDGLNHVRVGNLVLDILSGKKKEILRCNSGCLITDILKSRIKGFVWSFNQLINKVGLKLPKILARFSVREWNKEFLIQYQLKTMDKQKEFYAGHELNKKDLSVITYE